MNLSLKEFKKNLTVIILCGGKGSRLKPLTNVLPKPLIKIKKKTILEIIIDHFLKYQISNLILASGYKANKFDNFLKKNYKGFNIINIKTPEKWDIIKRVIFCINKTKTKYFMICYGDTFADINFDKLIKDFKKNEKRIFMVCHEMKTNFGLLKIHKNSVIKSFNEKPKLNIWFNIGYFLLDKEYKKLFKKFSLFKNFLISSSKKGYFKAFKHNGKHITINTISELEKAKIEIKEFYKNEKK